ncbi:MAG: glycosyl transferase family 1, partial [Candidatus Bathyarchaeia archaeon]
MILLVYRSYSSFVRNDYDILSKHFDVERFQWRGKRDVPRLAESVRKCDVTFSWFANDHAAVAVFLSRRFRKKNIVVVGGGDVAYAPEIDYGRFTQSKLKRCLSLYALGNADLILPVSNFTKTEVLRWVKPKRMEVVY